MCLSSFYEALKRGIHSNGRGAVSGAIVKLSNEKIRKYRLAASHRRFSALFLRCAAASGTLEQPDAGGCRRLPSGNTVMVPLLDW